MASLMSTRNKELKITTSDANTLSVFLVGVAVGHVMNKAKNETHSTATKYSSHNLLFHYYYNYAALIPNSQ